MLLIFYEPQRPDHSVLCRQFQEVDQELNLLLDPLSGHPVDAPEILEGLLDREFHVEGQFLKNEKRCHFFSTSRITLK